MGCDIVRQCDEDEDEDGDENEDEDGAMMWNSGPEGEGLKASPGNLLSKCQAELVPKKKEPS